ncbi:MAG: Ig-like domain-containing protein [bacterium]|nr:MAG: Ig-like domain-containing protein [bacterium]
MDAVEVTVTVLDGQWFALPGAEVVLSATDTGGGNIYDQPGLTGVDGVAVGRVRSTVAEDKWVRASAGGQVLADSVLIAFVPGVVNSFILSHDGPKTAGQPAHVTIDVRDAENNTVITFSDTVKLYTNTAEIEDRITWGIHTALGSIVEENGDTLTYLFSTGDNGVATLSLTDERAESITIFASYGAVLSSTAIPLVIDPAAADSVFVLSGDGQTGTVAQPVPSPLVVGVEDTYGNRVPLVDVTFSASGDGSVDTEAGTPGQQDTATTDAQGRAQCDVWTLGTVSGTDSDTLTATIATGTDRETECTATALPGAPNTLVLTPPGNRIITVGDSTVVTATLRDEFSNLAFGENVTIFIKDSADGHLAEDLTNSNPTFSSGPSARYGTTDATGTITVSYHAPDTADLTDILDAYHADIPAGSVDDLTFTTVASGATKLRVTVLDGQTSQAGVTFSFLVEAVDGSNNLDTTDVSRILLSAPPQGGFEFSLTDFGDTTTTADLVEGQVTLFGRGSKTGSWTIDVDDTASILTPTDFPIDIVPNDTVDHYDITTPTYVTADDGIACTVHALDRFDNLVTTATYDIDLRAVQAADTSQPASDTLSIGTGSIVSGIFSESGIRYLTAERIRIEISDDSTDVVGYSDTILVDHADAYRLVEISGDSTGVTVGDSVILSAAVYDIYENPVDEEDVTFVVQAGGGGLADATKQTDTDGIVAVRFGTGTTVGTNTVMAQIQSGVPESLKRQYFTVITVPKAEVDSASVVVEGTEFEAGESFSFDVAVYDEFGNLITTDSTTRLIPVAEVPSVSFASETLLVEGGTASGSAYDTLMGTNRITVESLAGVVLAPYSAAITIDHAPAGLIEALSSQDTSVTAGTTVGLSVAVFDIFWNPVGEEAVSYRIVDSPDPPAELSDDSGDPDDGIVLTETDGSAVCSLITSQTAGPHHVTASIFIGQPPQEEEVDFNVLTGAGAVFRYGITAVLVQTAGVDFTATITAYDSNNNVLLGDDSTRVVLGSDGNAVFSPDTVTLTDGVATAVVNDTVAEQLVLSAETETTGTPLNYSETITVLPGLPGGTIGISTVDPDTITANGISKALIVTDPVRDSYGNVVTSGHMVAVVPDLGTVTSDDADTLTPEVERLTGTDGRVRVFVQSTTVPGVGTVQFTSLEGTATGTAQLIYAEPPACEYADSISPVVVAPGDTVAFSCAVRNNSPTGLHIDGAASTISFTDGIGHTYTASLGASDTLDGFETDTLTFTEAELHEDFLGGTYTPRVSIVGTDVYESTYSVTFDTGSNSVSVTHIEIVSIIPTQTMVSRGSTVEVKVVIKNNGGSLVELNEINYSFGHGHYDVAGVCDPPLPDTLLPGSQGTYGCDISILPNCRLGVDTIYASARASVGGVDVTYDSEQYGGFATWTVQSAAAISYVAQTLHPQTVSQGQDQSFSLELYNAGQAAVILDSAMTYLWFTDGADTFVTALDQESALPGNRSSSLEFPASLIPQNMDAPGTYPVTLEFNGTENGAIFAETLVLGDSVTVVVPAAINYAAGSVSPATVSRRSSVAFSIGIINTGGATVDCIPDSTSFAFSDGTTEYRALLDGERGTLLNPGLDTLFFRSEVISDTLDTRGYTPTVEIVGTEYGVPFREVLDVQDTVTVQEPSQLEITSTTVSQDHITADQSAPWEAFVTVENNGQATVRLDGLTVRLFNVPAEVTDEYVIETVDFVPGVDSITGGNNRDIRIRFSDEITRSMTTGTVIIESLVWGKDLNSDETLVATTEFGGKGHFLVQAEADIAVTGVVASVERATVNQSREWTVDIVLVNDGESDFRLDTDPDSTDLTFSPPGDFTYIGSDSLAGGGTLLEGGSVDTLRFTVLQTASVADTYGINAEIRGVEVNSGRRIGPVSAATDDRVIVEEEADLFITALRALQDSVTIGQEQDWIIEMTLENRGGSALTLRPDDIDSTWVSIPGWAAYQVANPAGLVGGGVGLGAAESGALHFSVTQTGSAGPGRVVLTGAAVAFENNSGRSVYGEMDAAASTDSMTFQRVPAPRYVIGSIRPPVVSSGTYVSLECEIASDDPDHAMLVLDPERTYVEFGDADGDTFTAYLSAASNRNLVGGNDVTLIFTETLIDQALEWRDYPVAIHLEGLENGNPFSDDLDTGTDSITVEDAPKLSIQRILVPPAVTRDQGRDWYAQMVLQNNGEAAVVVDLDPPGTGITFSIVGSGDRTAEYTVVPPGSLSIAETDTLWGGRTDTLVFTVDSTGTTSGTALVNGRITGLDVNSGLPVADSTFSGGWSPMLIQEPGLPVIASAQPSHATVTSAQVTPWTLTLEVCNNGEADLTLLMDSTYIFADPDTELTYTPPAGFDGSGVVLGGGECRNLTFEITPTPRITGGANLALHGRVGFVENNSQLYAYFDTEESGSGSGSIEIQEPAHIRITTLENRAFRTPFVNRTQRFPVVMQIENTEEAAVDSIEVTLSGSGASVIENSPKMIPHLEGNVSHRDTFFVRAADSSGPETFTADIVSALDANSGEPGLVLIMAPFPDDTAGAVIQRPGDLLIESFEPSQPEVSSGQTVDWTVTLSLFNQGEAPIILSDPDPDDITFHIDGSQLLDYLVVAPDTFGSGGAGFSLAGGARDSLIYLISTTGSAVGDVEIRASTGWIDGNQPELVDQSQAVSSIVVTQPSGLRIESVSSDAPNNQLYPNTSVIDTGQVFNVTVVVSNTGGDDLDSVEVSLVCEGGNSTTNLLSAAPMIDSGLTGEFIFEVTASSTPGDEILRAAIEKAVSRTTGERISPIQAVESVEYLRVQLPASLHCTAWISSPAGAVDDTVSTDQDLTVSAVVDNTGQADVDDTGEIAITVPLGFALRDPGVEPRVRPFQTGRELSWTLTAPHDASVETVSVGISRLPHAANTADSAAAPERSDEFVVVTEDRSTVGNCALSIISPTGAVDNVLSTEQEFQLRATFERSLNSDSVRVDILVPSGFMITGRTDSTAVGGSIQHTITWTIDAPDNVRTGELLELSTDVRDGNSGIWFAGCGAQVQVDVVRKAVLYCSYGISGPEEALDGVLSTRLPFTLEASVENMGDAAVDTTDPGGGRGARLEITLPEGYSLDGAGETYLKPFYPGEPVVWRLRASPVESPPENIFVRFVEPLARDVNTNMAADTLTGEPQPVQTQAGWISMSNISYLDAIPPDLVPQGAQDVPVMRIVYDNGTVYTVGFDIIYVEIEDRRGGLLEDPSRSISSLELVTNDGIFTALSPVENPVPIVIGHVDTVSSGAQDTVLLRVDIDEEAPQGILYLDIAGSDDVVCSITLPGGEPGPRIAVRHNGDDIGGHFRSEQLSVMSSRFEDYVHNYPNPFQAGGETTKISYCAPVGTTAQFRIYDLMGRLVWTHDERVEEGGGTAMGGDMECGDVEWDGRNDRGQLVRNGVYICIVKAGSHSATFKIAVAK